MSPLPLFPPWVKIVIGGASVPAPGTPPGGPEEHEVAATQTAAPASMAISRARPSRPRVTCDANPTATSVRGSSRAEAGRPRDLSNE